MDSDGLLWGLSYNGGQARRNGQWIKFAGTAGIKPGGPNGSLSGPANSGCQLCATGDTVPSSHAHAPSAVVVAAAAAAMMMVVL